MCRLLSNGSNVFKYFHFTLPGCGMFHDIMASSILHENTIWWNLLWILNIKFNLIVWGEFSATEDKFSLVMQVAFQQLKTEMICNIEL